MSLAGFSIKKKPKKSKKKDKKKKKKQIVEEVQIDEEEKPEDAWDDGTSSPLIPRYNELAKKIGVVDTTSEKDKPAHEKFTKDIEAAKEKMGFHATRRAFATSAEEKKDGEPQKPAPVPRWGAPKSTRLNITDTKAFPSLGGAAPVVVPTASGAQNPWNKTEEENSELIHMALKAEKKEYVACTQFFGYEYGYFFKNGPHGLGYYKDPHPRDMDAPIIVEEPEAASPSGGAESKEGSEPARRFGKKKKKKKPKAKAAAGDGAAAEGAEEGATGEKKKKKKKKEKKKKKKKKDVDADVDGEAAAAAAAGAGDDAAVAAGEAEAEAATTE